MRLDRIPRLSLHRACTTVCLGVLLSACGGGGDGAVPGGSGGSSRGAATGPVSGFGSILVNGIRFADGAARVMDDEGQAHTTADLQLGMMVDVTSGAITPGSDDTPGQAAATQIVYGSSVKGRVTARNLVSTPPTLTVSGQTVAVPSGTVFAGYTAGISGVSTSDLVEIHALFDPSTQRYLATRIERRAELTECKVVGVARGVDIPLKAFVLGGVTVSYTGATVSGLSENATVRVKLAFNDADNTCSNVATSVTGTTPPLTEGARTKVEGYISDYLSPSSFRINGVPARTSLAITGLGDGVQVQAEGLIQAGALNASTVEVRNPLATREVRLFGAASSADLPNQTFVLKGVTVFYASPLFENGASLTSLSDGTLLDVRGSMDASGTRLLASRIRREN